MKKMRKHINLLVSLSLIIFCLAAGYLFIDHKADQQALQAMEEFVDKAQSEGVDLQYRSIDASPLSHNIMIHGLDIIGTKHEADIHLAELTLSGFNWQSLTSQQPQLPKAMSLTINNAAIVFKASMLEHNAQLQDLIEVFGDKLNFSVQLSYAINPHDSTITLTASQYVDGQFYLTSAITLGSIEWLVQLSNNDSENVAADKMMETTLNSLNIQFKNEGLIDKLRLQAMNQSGLSAEQLTQQSVDKLKQIRTVAQIKWGQTFIPLIDQAILFAQHPQQLTLSIQAESPLPSQLLLLASMGGDAGLLALIKEANIKITAN